MDVSGYRNIGRPKLRWADGVNEIGLWGGGTEKNMEKQSRCTDPKKGKTRKEDERGVRRSACTIGQ